MTDNAQKLKQEITTLRSTNKSFLVDAIYQGIEEVINSGVQPCRVIIIFTDGNSSGERYSIDDCIGLALANKVRIFLVGIDASNALSQLAENTGGRYFGDISSQTMEYIYSNVTTIINSICFPTCSIRYDASCFGEYQRTIELTLRDLSDCPGSEITATKSYKLPSDYLLPLRIEEVVAKHTVTEIPVRIFIDQNTFDTLDAISFEVTYDSTVATFLRIETNGSVLDSGVVRWDRIPQGIRITTTRALAIDSGNVLLTLIFRTDAFSLERECPLEIRNWFSSQPCVYPKFTRGRITVLATPTGVIQEIASTASMTLEQNYPNPFSDKTTIRYTLRDAGMVTLDVYDVFGRIVATLVNEVLGAGEHNIPFIVKSVGEIPSSSLPPGVYFYRLRRGSEAITNRMIVR